MGLEQLSPAYRAQYEAAIPEIQRKARAASQARGMFYSGDATDSETRAEADLLASLAGESAAAEQQTSENAKNRAATATQSDKEISATKRAQTLGIIGTGVGAAGTIAGLKYLNPSGPGNIFQGGPTGLMRYDPKTGTVSPVPSGVGATPGVGGATINPPVGSGVGGLDSLPTSVDAPGDFSVATAGRGVGGASPIAGAAPSAIAAPGGPSSMWSDAKSAGVYGLAAGAAGGLTGNAASAKIGGGHSLAGDIGSGIGGLGGGLWALQASGGNPWLAGLGALGGSFGGGLIGNLFK